jgi:choline-sulfatase
MINGDAGPLPRSGASGMLTLRGGGAAAPFMLLSSRGNEADRIRSRELSPSLRRLLHSVPIFLFYLVGALAAFAAARPPNIIIVNTDDHAQWAVGAYGNREVHTPNIDRLAREGMKFNRAFTKPVCSPSRAMMLTGRYAHRLGIPDYIPYGDTRVSGPGFVDTGLRAGTPTIASLLKEIGYTNALIGKWHLGYGEKYYPERFGFDVAEGHPYLAPGKQYDPEHRQLPVLVDGKELKGSFVVEPRHTDVLTDRAIHFVRSQREKPFFLFYSIDVPHERTRFTSMEEDLAHYQGRTLTIPDLSRFPEVTMAPAELRRLLAIYYGHITCADRNLGRLLATVEELGLKQNTLVIFLGDNGFNFGHHGMRGKGNGWILDRQRRNTRPNMFDTSIMIPFIVRWPGVIAPGQTSDAFVSTIDLLPTIIAAAGSRQESKVDGRSLLPLLRGERGVAWRDDYSDTYDMIYLGNNGEKPRLRMIRTDRWKLILYLDANYQPLDNGTRHELFDLQKDPEELNNLYGHADVLTIQQQLDTRLRAWMRETGVTANSSSTARDKR